MLSLARWGICGRYAVRTAIRASPLVRAAAALKSALNVDADLVEGKRGEFTVLVGTQSVAHKSMFGFPSDEDVVAAVRDALKAT